MVTVAIYFWAMRVCLTTDKINQMMEEVVPPEVEGMGYRRTEPTACRPVL